MPLLNPPLPIVHLSKHTHTHQQQPSHSLNLKPHEIDLIPSWYCCWCYILKPCSQQAKGDCFDLAEKWVLTYFCWNTRLLSEEMTECLFRGSRSNASKCSVGFPISFTNLKCIPFYIPPHHVVWSKKMILMSLGSTKPFVLPMYYITRFFSGTLLQTRQNLVDKTIGLDLFNDT